MDEEEEINSKGFMVSDDDDDEPLELDDDVGAFKFDEEPEEDPDDKYH